MSYDNPTARCRSLAQVRYVAINVNHMTLKILLLFVLAVTPTEKQSAPVESNMPVFIHDLQARFVGTVFERGKENTMTQFCQFHVTCTIIPQDTSFWNFLPLKIVGSLSAGGNYTANVNRNDLRMVGQNLFSFEFDLNTLNRGWATFTLTSRDAADHKDVYFYETHSNLVDVFLRCEK